MPAKLQFDRDSVQLSHAGQISWYERARLASVLAELGLFCLAALLVCVPSGLLPFAVLLLLSSALGVAQLRRSAHVMGWPLRLLLWLAVLMIVMGLLWMQMFEHGLRDVGNRSRFLALPWVMLWVYALRPRRVWLWRGAVIGVIGALLLATLQVMSGQPRAEGWSNAIVLADMLLVLVVLVLFCRAQHSWRVPLLIVLAACVVIVLTGSRGVWLGLAATVLVLAACMRWASVRTRLLLLGGLAALAVALVLMVPGLTAQLRLAELQQDVARLEAGDSDSSAGARVERLQVAWDTFLEQPWRGVGIDRFDDAMRRLPVCQAEWRQRCHLGHAHNDLAEWAATQGGPGIMLLLAVYGIPLLLFLRLHRDSGRRSFRGPAAAGMMVVIVYILCGLTQSMFAHQLTASFYVVIVAVLSGLALRENHDRHAAPAGELSPNL
jgi:O-antigen ligase